MTITREELIAFMEDLKREGYNVSRLERIKDGDMFTLLEEFNKYMDDVNELIALRKEFLKLDIRDPEKYCDLIAEIEKELWDPDAVDHLRNLIDMLKTRLISDSRDLDVNNARGTAITENNTANGDREVKKEIWFKTHRDVQKELFNIANEHRRKSLESDDIAGEVESPSEDQSQSPQPQSYMEKEESQSQPEVVDENESQDDEDEYEDWDEDESAANQNEGSSSGAIPSVSVGPSEPKEDDGKKVCRFCRGTGKCYSCNGTGKCYWCHGTGKITKDGEEKVCPYCGGTGKCYWCHGTGVCSKCNGTGYLEE